MSRAGNSDPVTPHYCLTGSQATNDLEEGVEGTLQNAQEDVVENSLSLTE